MAAWWCAVCELPFVGADDARRRPCVGRELAAVDPRAYLEDCPDALTEALDLGRGDSDFLLRTSATSTPTSATPTSPSRSRLG